MEKFNLDNIDIYGALLHMHEGVIISDTSGTIRFFNETQGKIDNIAPKDAIGKKITDLYLLNDETSFILRCLKNGNLVSNETFLYRTRFGKKANIIINVYPIFNLEKIIGTICFSRDFRFSEDTIYREQEIPKNKKTETGAQFQFSDIIGSDPETRNSIRIAMMSSNSPSPIMIYGETGTGKELFAQSIHNYSIRNKNPFIPVNCAAIPENLLEGILFGTSKGAFTGAIDKNGLFELAKGGTIFLDELDSMPLNLQAKLLRVTQEKKVRRLGSSEEIGLDVKIISSIGKPPIKIVKDGVLRRDLFYRLGVVFINLPPLREKKNELNKLVQHFITKYNKALNVSVSNVSKNVYDQFNSYHWPGNIRELEHVIEASMNMVAGNKSIKQEHLPLHFLCFTNKGSPLLNDDTNGHSIVKQELTRSSSKLIENQAESEKKMICNALEKSLGNAAKAARSLGISPQSFHYKLKKHRVRKQDYFKC